MVHFPTLFSAVALLSGFASAAPRPRPDSAVGDEVAVSAPNGIVLSDTVELASQKSAESAAAASSAYPAIVSSSPSWESVAASSVVTAAPYAQVTAPPYVASSANVYSQPAVYASPSSSAAVAYSSPSYGSGSSSWGSAYDSCVQQCVASFGGLTPSATEKVGTGATHTVIVAPTQGVLRYVPFTVNATVGDTVHFVWMANNHTVTKSSQLEVCNKTTTSLFASGTHDKGFTFDQVVNDTNPVFFYCATPGHCQKGMFGIINAPSVTNNVNTSVAMMMSSLTATNPTLASEASYVNKMTAGMEAANLWGGNIDMSAFPDWSHQYVAENVLYARSFMAQNPDVVMDDGSINLNTNAPLVWPGDLSVAAAAAASSSAASTPSASASGSPSEASSAAAGSATGAAKTNGATSKAVSSTLLIAATIVGAFIAL